MRITDAFLSFPTIAAVALFSQIQSFLSPEIYGSYMNISDIVVELSILQKLILHLNPTFIALVFFSWMPYARIIHTQILQVKQMQYIEAARAVGVKPLRMIFHHLLPNALTPAIVYTARDIGRMVVIQAAFTYIGMGGNSTWGVILQMGNKWIIGPGGSVLNHWWVILPITVAIVLFGIGWNLLGDELNVWMNPRANGIHF